MRSFVLILAFSILLRSFSIGLFNYAGLAISALLAFWVLYLLRLLTVSALDPSQLLHPGVVDYWIWSLGTCFIPMATLLFSRGWFQLKHDVFLKAIALISVGTLVLIIFNIAFFGLSNFLISGRLQLQSLNAISLGHSAALCVLLGVFFFSQLRFSRWYLVKLTVVLAVITLGLFLLFLTGSRGAQLALLVSLFYFILSQNFRLFVKIVTISFLASLFLAPTAIRYLKDFDVGAINRILNVLSQNDSALSSRIVSYNSALEVFYYNPMLGRTITEPVYGFYPHNVLIETLMSTGLVGFICLFVALSCGVIYGWRLMSRRHPSSWIALFYMQMLVGSMFSFAIYNNPGLWISLAGVIAVFSFSESESKKARRDDALFYHQENVKCS